MDVAKAKKEITIKRVSAFKFEIEVSNEQEKEDLGAEQMPVERISVIQRAPPSKKRPYEDAKEVKIPAKKRMTEEVEVLLPSFHEFQTRERALVPPGAVLIRDAIMYRIVEILLLKVLGEHQLKVCGYPAAPTYKILWGAVYRSCQELGAKSATSLHTQDHDCRGDMACFLDHVCRFLERCAPTKELWQKFGWTNLSVEAILRKIYCEQLVPFLRYLDLRQNLDILHSNADIVLLEKWESQGFTAVSWNGQKHFAQLSPDAECDARSAHCRHGCPGSGGAEHGGYLWHTPHRAPKEFFP